jgi:hypothetical protein
MVETMEMLEVLLSLMALPLVQTQQEVGQEALVVLVALCGQQQNTL